MCVFVSIRFYGCVNTVVCVSGWCDVLCVRQDGVMPCGYQYCVMCVCQDGVMLCVVGPGTSFGEGILTGKPHSVTVVTKDTTELLRVELKDFKLLWEVRTHAHQCLTAVIVEGVPYANVKKYREGRGRRSCSHHHHRHLSLNREGRWGTTDDFATSSLHFPLFSTALWDLPNSRPVHSLMLSSHLFLCLLCLLPPFTVPCKMVLARPDEWKT